MWFRVTNKQTSSVTVSVEPWGDAERLEAGASIGVFWHGPESAYVDMYVEPGAVVLWAEGGTDGFLQLDRDGDMDREIQQPVGVPSPPRFHRRSDIPSK